MRGIDSIANATTPRDARRSTPSRSASGSRKPISSCPSRRRATSASFGFCTLTTASASHGEPSVAPAPAYVASGNEAASPAPGSTTMSNPVAASLPAVSGTIATRRSPAAVSRATPTLIGGDSRGTAPYDGGVTHFVEHYGLWVVFVVVFFEVGGLPFIPGETALIAAAVIASQGHGNIAETISLAAAGAVIGAAVAYAVGRLWGRELLSVWPWFERVTKPGVDRSEQFFDRHGSKAVFLGRFLPVLRATLGWMAGVGRMSALRFTVWNVAGGVAWACAI